MRPILRDLSFTEAPRWHDGRLWFSDFYTHRVIAVEADGRSETIVTVPQTLRPWLAPGWQPADCLHA